MTELTAFIINLTGKAECIEVVYGYASTAFTRFSGDENSLICWGIDDKDITLREKLVLYNEADEETARSLIADMYRNYSHTPKDDLLTLAKEKRKAFLQQIALKLKPLGFKKKATSWTYALTDEYYLLFHAQKSAFSDEYYFNVYIGKNGTKNHGDCYYTRVAPQEMFPMDWQTLTTKEMDYFLEKTVLPALNQIIGTPLSELGKQPSYWYGCDCERNKCDSCWMEKSRQDLIEENIFQLPLETTDGTINLEVKHKRIPQRSTSARVMLSATVQGLMHLYESDATEKILTAFARNIPVGWTIRSCFSCRYGHISPALECDNELFCTAGLDHNPQYNLLQTMANADERRERIRTLFDCCATYEPSEQVKK